MPYDTDQPPEEHYDQKVTIRITRRDLSTVLYHLGEAMKTRPAGSPLHSIITHLQAQAYSDTEPGDA